METAVEDFKLVGVLKVDVDKVEKLWNDRCSISQWEEEYRLVEMDGQDRKLKVLISKKQAHEIIGRLDLIRIQSPIFRSGSTWLKTLHEDYIPTS